MLLSASGGGGGGGGGGGNTPTTFYVRESGDDGANGKSPETAFRTLERAVKNLGPGDEVFVGPGTYRPPVVAPSEPQPTEVVELLNVVGTERDPIRITADPTGAATGDPAGPVIVDGENKTIGVRLSRSQYVVIDGFEIINGGGDNGAGVQLRSESAHITVQHCQIHDSGDGIRLENAADALLFNNLIYANSNRGIAVVRGSQRARIINNTVAHNANRGVTISGVNSSGAASSGATLRNNIIQENQNISIFVDDGPPSSLTGYTGDYNLVFIPGLADPSRTYRPTDIVGAHDVHEDALFKLPEQGLYALDHASPAVDAGTSEGVGGALIDELLSRATSQDGDRDRAPVDLGFHYPATQ
ncbi:MAG: right-handed parallel beta-helix repeat-containing protein [Deltaproteobacteria bacterium]|nr:right-handed parallel beta-helix repeat-containing protein [Deltaproteobacteria bacterium]